MASASALTSSLRCPNHLRAVESAGPSDLQDTNDRAVLGSARYDSQQSRCLLVSSLATSDATEVFVTLSRIGIDGLVAPNTSVKARSIVLGAGNCWQ